ncbi:hypothetical protein [Actinomadura meyerae]|uniref:hypothetical protein n=1 Tax=Actinomadura meyerae TaxID=240840 RepID=UPI001178CD3E|nr:hypothetical protein [Actinomadura meyerae]
MEDQALAHFRCGFRSGGGALADYMEVVRERVVADGCEVTTEEVSGVPALVAYRSNWRALSKMHLFTVVAECESVDAGTLEQFTREASLLAKERKGAMRGAQSGVLVIAALVTEYADEPAKVIAGRPFRQGVGGFAALVQPAVVDLTDKSVHSFRGRRIWGAAFASYLRKKNMLYLPDPR